MIAACLMLSLDTACTGKGYVNEEETCGIGDSQYDLYAEGTVDTSFDCNTAGSFTVNLKPYVETDYIGFCRLWFELEKDWDIYRSNYVEFYPGHNTAQQLEWGGSLPTGTYEMTATMRNIQFSSSCPESVYWEYECLLGEMHIAEFTNPQKVMEIEYFCQDSDTGIIDRYDVFLSPNTEEYIDIAFNVANTTYNLTTYSTDLDPEIIEYEPFASNEIKYYIFSLKQWENDMLLCGIKGFKNTQGHLMPDLFGITYEDDTIGCVPTCSTGSLVAVKTCIDFAASDQYKSDYNELVTATVIHELGHQRGIWQHHDLQTPKFCIMKRVFIVYAYYHGEHPYWAVTYSNPHFCDQCINKVKNITWQKGTKQ